jgi:hypothetical protein
VIKSHVSEVQTCFPKKKADPDLLPLFLVLLCVQCRTSVIGEMH